VPGLVAGLVLAWALGLGRIPAMRAQGNAPGEASGTIAFTTVSPGTAPLLYLIDTRARALAVYRVDPVKGGIKLEAARQYRYDLQLAEYNNYPPEVAAVEAMISTAAAPRKP